MVGLGFMCCLSRKDKKQTSQNLVPAYVLTLKKLGQNNKEMETG